MTLIPHLNCHNWPLTLSHLHSPFLCKLSCMMLPDLSSKTDFITSHFCSECFSGSHQADLGISLSTFVSNPNFRCFPFFLHNQILHDLDPLVKAPLISVYGALLFLSHNIYSSPLDVFNVISPVFTLFQLRFNSLPPQFFFNLKKFNFFQLNPMKYISS